MPGMPPFTVVLPVRNGGGHVKDCVASVLAQTVGDFTLVVLDSGSTDGTLEWLRGVADSRLSLFPAAAPLSITENWARIREVPRGEFITLIGHDDLLDPDYLEAMGRLIAKHPAATLYQTHFRIVDEHGAFTRHCRPMPERESAAEFLAARLCRLRDSFGTGYLFRTETYDRVGGIPMFPKLLYADDALVLRATGSGYRATAPEERFSYRQHFGSAAGEAGTETYFEALEQYAGALGTLAETDPVLAGVLSRYGPEYFAEVAARWLRVRLEDSVTRGEPVDPAVGERMRAMLDRVAGADGRGETGWKLPPSGTRRLLEWAARSGGVGRLVWGAWRAGERARAAVRTRLIDRTRRSR